MVKDRYSDYDSTEEKDEFKDDKLKGEITIEQQRVSSSFMQNIMKPPNPDQDIFLGHKMVPHAQEGVRGVEDPYMSASEEEYVSAQEGGEEEPPMARSMIGLRPPMVTDRPRSRPTTNGDSFQDPSPRSVGRSERKFGRLPKIPKVPTLQDQLHLAKHLSICEELMNEEGVDMGRLAARVAIVESFSGFDELKKTAESMLQLTWPEIRNNLISDFADVNVIRSQLENRLLELKFDTQRMNAFLNSARALWVLRTPDIEQIWFVRRLFRTVPSDLVERVVTEARRLNSRADWTTLPMEQIFSLLSDAVIVRNAVMQVSSEDDQIRWVKEPQRGQHQKGTSSSLRPWIEARKGRLFVIFATGPEKWKEIKNKAKEFREAKSRKDGKPYWLVEFDNKEAGSTFLKQTLEQSKWREFKDSGSSGASN